MIYRLLAILGVILAGSAAQAATYNYVSEPGYCDYYGACWFPDGWQWTASFGIDESTLPGGSLASGSLSFEVVKVSEYRGQPVKYGTFVNTVRFTSLLGSYEFEALGSYPAGSFWGLGEFTWTEFISSFYWNFDSDARIIAWSGNAFCGGPCDQYSDSRRGDWVDDGWSTAGPGTWTRVIDPAPVPLPLPAASLALALGLMGLARRRRG